MPYEGFIQTKDYSKGLYNKLYLRYKRKNNNLYQIVIVQLKMSLINVFDELNVAIVSLDNSSPKLIHSDQMNGNIE